MTWFSYRDLPKSSSQHCVKPVLCWWGRDLCLTSLMAFLLPLRSTLSSLGSPEDSRIEYKDKFVTTLLSSRASTSYNFQLPRKSSAFSRVSPPTFSAPHPTPAPTRKPIAALSILWVCHILPKSFPASRHRAQWDPEHSSPWSCRWPLIFHLILPHRSPLV